jgi:cytochrome P450
MLLASEIDGERLTEKRVLEMCNLLFLAGLDTVTNAMTFMTKHLAENPDQQQRLRDNPDLIPAAVEEFMRSYAFVNVPRRVAADTELNGARLRKGDIIISSLSAASSDDRLVDNPEAVDLDRGKSPHLAFNTGPHNCAGAHMARLELRVFLEEWLKRVPMFAVAPGYKPHARGGPVMALERLDIRW